MDIFKDGLMKDFNFDDGIKLTEDILEEIYKHNLLDYLSKYWKISVDNYNKLYPFQIRGLEFLFTNYAKKRHTIVDYDSGMGKTVLICVFIDILTRTLNKVQTLIVCERNSFNHWYDHLTVWTDLCTANIIQGITQETELKKDKIVVIVEPKKLEDFIINSNWNFIIIDNFHNKEIMSNRNIKKLSGNKIKNSTLILLTNHVLKKPSHRPVLWEMLHFLDSKLVPSKKEFISKCLCSPEDRFWFPWKDFYLRMGWVVYPDYQEKMKAKTFTNKSYQTNDFEFIEKFNKKTNKLEIVDKSCLEIFKIDKKNTKTINIENQTSNPVNEITLSKDNTTNEIFETQPIKIPAIIQKQACSSNAPGGSYFIQINDEYLTPRCFQIRSYLHGDNLTIDSSNKPISNKYLNELTTFFVENMEDNFTQNYMNDSIASTSSKVNIRNPRLTNYNSDTLKHFQKEKDPSILNAKQESNLPFEINLKNNLNVLNCLQEENREEKSSLDIKNESIVTSKINLKTYTLTNNNLDISNSCQKQTNNCSLDIKNESIFPPETDFKTSNATNNNFKDVLNSYQKGNSNISLNNKNEPGVSSTPNSSKAKRDNDWNDIFENLISPKKSKKDENNSVNQTVPNNNEKSISDHLNELNKNTSISLSTNSKEDIIQENVSTKNKINKPNYLSQLFDKLVPPESSFRFKLTDISGNSKIQTSSKIESNENGERDSVKYSSENKSNKSVVEENEFSNIFDNIIKKK